MRRRSALDPKLVIPLAVVIVLTLVIGGLVTLRIVGAYSWSVEKLFRRAPVQPIAFSHKTHAGTAGIDCTFCHRLVTTEEHASVPPLEQCMFCHAPINQPSFGLAKDNPEIKKLVAAYQSGQPVDWVRVHKLPDHVQFTHMPHIQAGFTCNTCHGNVAQMDRVRQVRSLRMGDCLGCHRANNARTDCFWCHH